MYQLLRCSSRSLIHFMTVLHFYASWKLQKTRSFVIFVGSKWNTSLKLVTFHFYFISYYLYYLFSYSIYLEMWKFCYVIFLYCQIIPEFLNLPQFRQYILGFSFKTGWNFEHIFPMQFCGEHDSDRSEENQHLKT